MRVRDDQTTLWEHVLTFHLSLEGPLLPALRRSKPAAKEDHLRPSAPRALRKNISDFVFVVVVVSCPCPPPEVLIHPRSTLELRMPPEYLVLLLLPPERRDGSCVLLQPVYEVLVIEPRVSQMLGEHSTNDLQPQSVTLLS